MGTRIARYTLIGLRRAVIDLEEFIAYLSEVT